MREQHQANHKARKTIPLEVEVSFLFHLTHKTSSWTRISYKIKITIEKVR